ncbi:MAG: glutamate-5-semialdehyde dehydrogenase [Planctomycetota bacterium]|nr:glutamate-5-semialdehyde dehydrogenase [Planctomycetota bacterium]
MSTIEDENQTKQLHEYCVETAQLAKRASRALSTIGTRAKNAWLEASAAALLDEQSAIIEANAFDIEAAPQYGLSDAQIDRLVLNESRIQGIASALREIATLPDPIGETISGGIRPNGLEIRKVRVPLGSVFFIYESRPNVTADAAAICVKSGNAVILRGGKEAAHSSKAIVDILRAQTAEFGIPADAIQLVNTTDREAVGLFLSLSDSIDVAIPRGGKGLIERVARDATMPVIKHYDGNCHVYVDVHADAQMAVEIVFNSKCQRMGVCNACESLLIHHARATELLPRIAAGFAEHDVAIVGDARTCDILPDATPAKDADWGTEYLGPKISIKVVESLDEAVAHINQYGSHHTDAIVSQDVTSIQAFCGQVDSSAVIVNASTRFNDGGEFGLGAEIGISTDKFHARGPCGLQELTTYKYLVVGNGQTRE